MTGALLERPDLYDTTDDAHDAHFAEGRDAGPFDTRREPADQSDNLTRRGGIARLILGLRLTETRDLAIDILDTAYDAMERRDWELLRAAWVSWIETAEILVRARHRLPEMEAAREEGRQFLGSVQGQTRPERRKVPR